MLPPLPASALVVPTRHLADIIQARTIDLLGAAPAGWLAWPAIMRAQATFTTDEQRPPSGQAESNWLRLCTRSSSRSLAFLLALLACLLPGLPAPRGEGCSAAAALLRRAVRTTSWPYAACAAGCRPSPNLLASQAWPTCRLVTASERPYRSNSLPLSLSGLPALAWPAFMPSRSAILFFPIATPACLLQTHRRCLWIAGKLIHLIVPNELITPLRCLASAQPVSAPGVGLTGRAALPALEGTRRLKHPGYRPPSGPGPMGAGLKWPERSHHSCRPLSTLHDFPALLCSVLLGEHPPG
ncbi:uncharacterized protein PSFLO_05777 [Pseudozyma flocculosa]|uniref:Uncharacterized protein n=1 Tax=Pseudozyma flocculosa TaxID=84751 RepID=A0A5C3F9I2_9BASI|nr:uncharacterized protein PSFLO_05777 [Pseudozyma flocculosa]